MAISILQVESPWLETLAHSAGPLSVLGVLVSVEATVGMFHRPIGSADYKRRRLV